MLHGLSCAIPRGSVTGLLGPSGSGKTTLMRAVVGVQIVTSRHGHRARRAGRIRRAAPPGRLPHPGAERLRRPDRPGERPLLRRAATAVGAADADRAVADVGLAGAASQLVGTLSGGQRSRASLACAIVGQPELLVLDEPTVGQDPVLRDELWAQFHELAAAGTTLLVSSHVMDEAARCDRLLLIRDGRLIADDTPDAVTRRRRHRRPGGGVPPADPASEAGRRDGPTSATSTGPVTR